MSSEKIFEHQVFLKEKYWTYMLHLALFFALVIIMIILHYYTQSGESKNEILGRTYIIVTIALFLCGTYCLKKAYKVYREKSPDDKITISITKERLDLSCNTVEKYFDSYSIEIKKIKSIFEINNLNSQMSAGNSQKTFYDVFSSNYFNHINYYHIIDVDNREYLLLSAFGIPTKRIIRTLRSLNPDIKDFNNFDRI